VTNIEVRPMADEDRPAVEAIYRDGIDTGNATFEAEPPTWDMFNAGKLRVGRLVVSMRASDG
jgi:L-amino acid N-acyltransferase YncA